MRCSHYPNAPRWYSCATATVCTWSIK
ncbi:hypothetical protein MJ579_14110 [Klebsiella pneumoniae]|nr:hypothetical protein MJ579_14110 [Klebsiella pneumoniae]